MAGGKGACMWWGWQEGVCVCVCVRGGESVRPSALERVQVFCLEGWMEEHQCRRSSSAHTREGWRRRERGTMEQTLVSRPANQQVQKHNPEIMMKSQHLLGIFFLLGSFHGISIFHLCWCVCCGRLASCTLSVFRPLDRPVRPSSHD